MSAPTPAPNDEWWRGGVIYQIYPRSFSDESGDGVGDLAGVTARLDHVARLGADAIWLSPFFPSPMKDFGYDVSDYCGVDPLFGTLEDFRSLLARAHALGLRVMIDQVLSHSSDRHPWFVESRSSRTNARADWYVWGNARHDGTPPNNWLSIFGGSAWQWDTRRRQYYLHNFLTSQPDLNYHSQGVQQAVLDSVRFWLDLGVDGFRLDVVNFYFHDALLRDNPGRGEPQGDDPAVTAVNPYGWQRHLYDKSQPENLDFLRRLRALVGAYPNTAMVGEIGDDDGLARVAEYTQGRDLLHMAYCFDLLGPAHDARYLHRVLERFDQVVGDGWPSWALSNHDVVRVATRWGGARPDARLLQLAAAMQMSLRGSPCIYQGDELGLPEAELEREQLVDPYGIEMWPEFKGRDGCRTPFPWAAAAPQAGFSRAARTWLPVAAPHTALAVDLQDADPGSLLNFYRGLLRWRRTCKPLVKGSLRLLAPHDQVLAYERAHDGRRVLCAFNFSDRSASFEVDPGFKGVVAGGSGLTGARMRGASIEFEPWGGLFAEA